MQYKQVECIRKFENGTELQDRSCNIEEVSDLVRPCHNQPCGEWIFIFVVSPECRAKLGLLRDETLVVSRMNQNA